MSGAERCPRCDRDVATSAAFYACPDDCDSSCPKCSVLCWRAFNGDECRGAPIDWRQRAIAAERQLEHHRHGTTIESDAVCPDSLALVEARRERDEARAAVTAKMRQGADAILDLGEVFEADMKRVEAERDVARAEVEAMRAVVEAALKQAKAAECMSAVDNESERRRARWSIATEDTEDAARAYRATKGTP